MKTTFKDGSVFEGNDIQTALVCAFTASSRGGVQTQTPQPMAADTPQGRPSSAHKRPQGRLNGRNGVSTVVNQSHLLDGPVHPQDLETRDRGRTARLLSRAHVNTSMKPQKSSVLDWAETIICNAACPAHCTQNEWDEIVQKWLKEKHLLESETEARERRAHSAMTEILDPAEKWNETVGDPDIHDIDPSSLTREESE